MWNRNKRLHTKKKHVYKDRKETTHVEIGEEDIHHHRHIYIYICMYVSKISKMYVNMVTRSMYKKEVSIPSNKMKHISSLQRHVFLPLTCRILKRNHIFSTISPPFCHDWQRIQETRKLHPRMIKGVQGIHINAWM